MLKIEKLSVSYGSVRALTDVDLEVRGDGVLHGVIGPNGAGKSTLLDAVCGRRRPTTGIVRYRDEDITRRSVAWRRRQGMARSFQRTSIFQDLTVHEQLHLVAQHLGDDRLDDVIEVMDLNGYLDQKAGRIAYGVQRRVDVALALIGRPHLLLMDEPGAGLSAAETLGLFEHLRDLVRERKIGLVVEHDVDAIRLLRRSMLDPGGIAMAAPGNPRRPSRRRRLSRDRRMNALRIEKLVAGYGASTVLHGVDLTVDEGESVAVVGRNGAGKSTLLLPVFRETNIISGAIWVRRVIACRLYGCEAGISIAPQGRRILPNLTVKENLLLSKATGRAGYWSLRAVYDLFPVLEERANRPGTMLSGGQQQMLAIGRALMANPSLILLDEPSEGLSPVLIDGLVGALNTIRKAGTGVLVVEQHLNLVKRATDRFIILAKGEVVGSDPTGAIGAPRTGADGANQKLETKCREREHEENIYRFGLGRAVVGGSGYLSCHDSSNRSVRRRYRQDRRPAHR
jgi:ABC-type branched-subunit amino acid transport system ATPase component